MSFLITTSHIPKDVIVDTGINPCNCVKTARILNPELPYGLISRKSKLGIINTQEAEPGATVVTKEGYWYHVATVAYETDDYITVIEANYKRCKVTARTIRKDSQKIAGYYINNQL